MCSCAWAISMFTGVEGGVLCDFTGLPPSRKVSGGTVTSSGGLLKSLRGDRVSRSSLYTSGFFPQGSCCSWVTAVAFWIVDFMLCPEWHHIIPWALHTVLWNCAGFWSAVHWSLAQENQQQGDFVKKSPTPFFILNHISNRAHLYFILEQNWWKHSCNENTK